jgi:soluble lytic murein transglycosylase-like protein
MGVTKAIGKNFCVLLEVVVMKKHCMLLMSIRILVIAVLWTFKGISPAGAELEAYNFPLPRPSDSIDSSSLMAPVSKDTKAQRVALDLKRRNEAKKQSIVELFQQYNKKLSDEEAESYALYIMQACEKFSQDPLVIAAVIVNESTVRRDALSKGGDYGLMQVRWRVHQKKIKKKYPHIEKARDMFDPKDNVLVGTEIFSACYAVAKQDVRGALLRYSAGNERLAEKVVAVLSKLEKEYLARLKNG